MRKVQYSNSIYSKKIIYEFFFKFSPWNLLNVLYKLIKVSNLCLQYFPRYHICKIAEYKIQKRAITQKASYDFFLKMFTKYSTDHSLSANTGFKSLAFILFEILHLQNCDVKFQNFQRAITQKKSYEFFLKFHHIIYSLYSISC